MCHVHVRASIGYGAVPATADDDSRADVAVVYQQILLHLVNVPRLEAGEPAQSFGHWCDGVV